MCEHTQGWVVSQRRSFRRFLNRARDLCFESLLPRAQIEQVLARHPVRFRRRLYTPLVTLWTFLYQMLGQDQSCRAAVCRLLAWLCLEEVDQANPKTDPYCKARERLPEALVADLFRQSGRDLQQRFPASRMLHGRPIVIADGTTVSMPDTPENQSQYPQSRHHRSGVGFPILRLVGLISLSCGGVLDVAIGPWRGKQTGETALLRKILGSLQAGAVLLADGMFANYWTIALLLQQEVDLLSHHDGKRRINWRAGRHVGQKDHVVEWKKPPQPKWMSPELYKQTPDTLRIRETAAQVQQAGFRTRSLVLVSTLLDSQLYPKGELALAYRARWHAELDLRSIKQVMQMDILRCKTPAMVRKELWMHLLAYNVIRRLMAEAAMASGADPRDISFKGTLQTLREFGQLGWFCSASRWARVYRVMLRAVAAHRVNDRPDRIEPRAVKRRPKPIAYLNEPRAIAKARLLNGR